ncbi:MAG TPA: S-adenosylmethionine:tRNA ribosyltransferase-isomerase [Polyangia bacterium]|nr:S-adenosylmethionine:tRNA ribosyltransferase-isomerase [Polyangia bacterium]
MTAASWPRGKPARDRLLCLEPRTGRRRDRTVGELPTLLAPGDLVVVNDSATLPASLGARLGDAPVELRLAGERAPGVWEAVLFGPGDWRTRTEDRPAPPEARAGDRLALGPELAATIAAVSPISPRLLTVRFDQEPDLFWPALYRHGRPIQYAYAAGPLELWHTQTSYASRPWSVEAPSAGRPLEPSLLAALARRGVALATLTHAAGLSSTGDAALDRALPLPERYDVPAATVAAIEAARAREGRVVAVGTTVVRALEGCAGAHDGRLVAGVGVTDLRIGAGFRAAVASGILTGMHEPEASHFSLLEAFAPRALLADAHAHAEAAGYLAHEFGDSMLILPEPARAAARRAFESSGSSA